MQGTSSSTRPPTTSSSPWSSASEIGLSPRRMATGFSSVREGSHTKKDQQLDAANYNVQSSYKQRTPGGAGLSVIKS